MSRACLIPELAELRHSQRAQPAAHVCAGERQRSTEGAGDGAYERAVRHADACTPHGLACTPVPRTLDRTYRYAPPRDSARPTGRQGRGPGPRSPALRERR
jgi:hypothetical protein